MISLAKFAKLGGYETRERAKKKKYLRHPGENEDPSYYDIKSANTQITIMNVSLQYKRVGRVKQRLLKIAKILSKVMPKPSDESLLEIDDVLYENYEKFRFKEYPSSAKSKFLDCLEIAEYNDCYRRIIRKGFCNHELDTIYLRLAENLGGVHFTWIFWDLACSRDERKICLFLKIFKSCLKVSTNGTAFQIIQDYTYESGFPFYFIQLHHLTIPSGREVKRITEFIVKQAGACLEYFKEDVDLLKEPKKFLKYSMIHFEQWDDEWTNHYQYALLDAFMSAKDMNERKELLKVFVEVLHQYARGRGSINGLFNVIFKSLSCNLKSIAGHITEKDCDEDMRSIDQEYGYNIGPYWSECVGESPKDTKDKHDKVNKLTDTATTNSPSKSEVVNRDQMIVHVSDVDAGISEHFQYDAFIKDLKLLCDAEFYLSEYLTFAPCHQLYKSDVDSFSKETDLQEHDCCKSTFEILPFKVSDSSNIFKKFFVYDDFMKCLHLMSILHTAFTKYEVLHEDEEFLNNTDKPAYYSSRFSCTMITGGDKLYSDLENKKVSWPLEMAIIKCPFLYLKPSACHLKMEYLKSLKGEPIDEAVQEEFVFCWGS